MGWSGKELSIRNQSRDFYKICEHLAVKSSDYLISDSIGIQEYLKKTYKKDSKYIAYGADVFIHPDENQVKQYKVKPYNYNMLIARLEPENNTETIFKGVSQANSKTPFLVIGKHDVNEYGKYLKKKFKSETHIKFIGGIYNLVHLNNLRYFSNLYFHGHSVGGTNPSLLEAMASGALIIANDNIFNKAAVQNDAFYFSNSENVKQFVDNVSKKSKLKFIENNINKIKSFYNWSFINQNYLDFILSVYE